MQNGAQVVAITGASAGVGRATARAFAKRGANVALLARGRDGLEGARREVEDLGRQALVLPLDVADEESVEGAVDAIERDLGPIDVWVNCAMVTVFSPIAEMSAAEFRRVTEVNYLGYVHGTLSVLRRMRERDRGTLVQVSSALAFRSIPLQSAYCASKAAIVRFSESLRTELLHDGSKVHVTVVHMPALNTPQFGWSRTHMSNVPQPVPPIFEPEVAANAIVWAAHHKRKSLAVGASTVQAIFGEKIAPGLLDRLLSRKGYSSQLTDEPVDPQRPDNLYNPAPGDHGARGRYSHKAKGRSYQLSANTHRALLTVIVGGLLTWWLVRRR